MKGVDGKFIQGLGSKPFEFLVSVHKKFNQPYGGKATKAIRNAYDKRKIDLGLTVKNGDEDPGDQKQDLAEAQLRDTRIATLFNRAESQPEPHGDDYDNLSDQAEREAIINEENSPERAGSLPPSSLKKGLSSGSGFIEAMDGDTKIQTSSPQQRHSQTPQTRVSFMSTPKIINQSSPTSFVSDFNLDGLVRAEDVMRRGV